MGAYRTFDRGDGDNEDAAIDPALVSSLLAWWQDAGVDIVVDDAPRDWLAPPAPAPERRPAASPAPPASAGLPDSIAGFLPWRGGEGAPERSWRGAAIPATGPLDAPVMILVDCPERDDRDALMGGEVGRLFDRMLAAIGLSRETVHLAAVCLKRPLAGRLPADTEARLTELARAHVGLAAPRRLLVMGNAASRAILGTEMLDVRGRLHPFNHNKAQLEVVASFHPRQLLERPAQKAEAWRDLQLLMGGMSA